MLRDSVMYCRTFYIIPSELCKRSREYGAYCIVDEKNRIKNIVADPDTDPENIIPDPGSCGLI